MNELHDSIWSLKIVVPRGLFFTNETVFISLVLRNVFLDFNDQEVRYASSQNTAQTFKNSDVVGCF